MKRSTWLRKALWLAPLLLIVLLIAGVFALRSYLSSGRAARQVAQRLQALLGGRVEVQAAHIGLVGDSTVQGITAYADSGEPWLQVDGAEADLSALSVLRDRSPEDIHLRGARIVLHFSSSGHMVTQLPAPKKEAAPTAVPRLHIEQGELTLNQEGQPAMVVRGINADVVPGAGGMTLTGTINDPFWGDWKAQGAVDKAAGKTSITLDTDGVDVTMEKLRSIAFVPPKVWKEVFVEGHTPAKVQLDLHTGGDRTKAHYRVEIEPRDAHVKVPAIDLQATQAHGKAVVADELVKLEGVHGKTAGGEIMLTSADLNFRDEPTRLTFKVGVADVVLHDLPKSWKVPPKIDGRLTGSADLVVTIAGGKVSTAGSGEGELKQASWSGFQIKRPIRLALHSDGRRFRFRQPKAVTVAQQDLPEARARAAEVTSSRYPEVVAEESSREDDQEAGSLEGAPARLVGEIGRGVQWGTDQLSRGIDAVTRGLGKLKPPARGEQPTYLDVDLNLQNVDVAQLIQKLKLNLPVEIAGRLTIQVHASIPINTAGDTKAYRFRGDAKLPTLTIAGVEMTDVEGRARYADGVLNLEKLRGRMPRPKDPKTAGTFDGDARVQVIPEGELRLSLKVQQIPLDAALNALPATRGQATGLLSGDVEAHANLATLADPSTWRGSAHLTAPAVEVYGLPLRDVSAALIVGKGQATLTAFKADVAGTPLTGQGGMELTGAYPFKAGVRLDRTDLAALNRLAPSFRPPIQIKGDAQLSGSVSGTLKPFRFDSAGQVQARELVAEGVKVDDLSFRWSRAGDGMKLDAIKASLYGGEVTGSAVVPLAASATGTAKLNLRNLDVQTLAKSLPSFPVRLEGKVSGDVNGKLSPTVGDRPRSWTTDIELAAPKLRVQGIPTEKLKGTIDSRAGKTSYRLEGESLGGTFTLKGELPPEAQPKKKDKPEEDDGPGLLQAGLQKPAEPAAHGRLEVRGARLSRLWDAYNITGGLAHLRGRFSLELAYRHTGPTFFPVGNGTFQIVRVRWDDEILAESLQGEVRLTANELQLFNVTGDAADGLFMGRFVFGLKPNSASWFDIEVQQAEASRLLVPLPAVAAHVKGPVDLNLRGRIGQEWDGGGGATLTRGQVYGLDVTEWRIPMQFRFVPSQGAGELTVRDSHARIAQGRARFESTLTWGNGLRLRGTLLFYQVDLRTLLRHSPSVAAYASGRVTGRVELSGDEMRSINDLRAFVQARLEQGQALQLPVLRQITPYLRPGVSSATFQSGDLKGRLANGIFRVERLTLLGELLQLLAQGTVNLAGNLNLEVTAQTGLYCLNPARNTNNLDSRIPLIGAIPRLILYEASSILANRVVHLRVTGTVRSPSVRLEPIILLTEEAVRFFLGRFVAPSIPAIP